MHRSYWRHLRGIFSFVHSRTINKTYSECGQVLQHIWFQPLFKGITYCGSSSRNIHGICHTLQLWWLPTINTEIAAEENQHYSPAWANSTAMHVTAVTAAELWSRSESAREWEHKTLTPSLGRPESLLSLALMSQAKRYIVLCYYRPVLWIMPSASCCDKRYPPGKDSKHYGRGGMRATSHTFTFTAPLQCSCNVPLTMESWELIHSCIRTVSTGK